MIKCSECKYYKGRDEFCVSKIFVDGEGEYFDGHVITPPLNVVSECFPIPMCYHSACFKFELKRNPVIGEFKEKIRIKGQGQLNKNNDCKYFEPSILKKLFSIFKF